MLEGLLMVAMAWAGDEEYWTGVDYAREEEDGQ